MLTPKITLRLGLLLSLCVWICLPCLGQEFPEGISSKAGDAGSTIEHRITLNNPTNQSQQLSLAFNEPEALGFTYHIENKEITLPAGSSMEQKVLVDINENYPKGAYENARLLVKSRDEKLLTYFDLFTVRSKSHPFLLVNPELLQEAGIKIKTAPWAKENALELKNLADNYEVPKREVITKARPTKVWSSLNYSPQDMEIAFKVGLAYKLFGNQEYLEKLKKLILEVADAEAGYLSIGAATSGVQVHEGGFFQFYAALCDLLYEEEVFSEQEKSDIENTMKHFLHTSREHMSSLGIMNHQASANVGALMVALFLEDIEAIHFMIKADGGMADQIGRGVMSDGWWFEGTPGYCYLVTHKYLLAAQALSNYGWDIYHYPFPYKYKSKDFDTVKEGFTGMKFEIWGPVKQPSRSLSDMAHAYIPMMDNSANLVANNDGVLTSPHPFYEIAYRAYRSPELAWVLSHSERDSWEALMYGIDELPLAEDPRMASASLPNVGLTALRAQGIKDDSEKQFEVYTKYGTHGGWHGHFDRTALLDINKDGHHFFGTEMAWFGYGSPGYKEFVQTSAAHNMVVVDEMQQEAIPANQVMLYSGQLLQANMIEVMARWREIPTFNIDKFPPWDDKDYLSEHSPVFQRRLTVLTDDYLILADFMEAEESRTYDWLFHPVGFRDIQRASPKGGLLDSVSTDHSSPYKYFSQGQWYSFGDRARLSFEDQGHAMDLQTLWPKEGTSMLATYANGGKQRDIRNNPDRRTYLIREEGTQAVFINLIEPHSGAAQVESISNDNPEQIMVKMKDGSQHIIKIRNLQNPKAPVTVGFTKIAKDGSQQTETAQ